MSQPIVYQGKRYASLAELPPAIRVLLDAEIRAAAMAASNPDEAFFQKLLTTPSGPARDGLIAQEKAARQNRRTVAGRESGVMSGDGSPRTGMWWALGFVVVALAAWWWR